MERCCDCVRKSVALAAGAILLAERCSSEEKSLAMCLTGQLRNHMNKASYEWLPVVAAKFQSYDVVGISRSDECEMFHRVLKEVFPGFEAAGELDHMLCFDEDTVRMRIKPAVDGFVSRGWAVRQSTTLQAGRSWSGWWETAPDANATAREWLDGDEGYYFRSTLVQASARRMCHDWVYARQSMGVQYEWILFSRFDIHWRSFPEVHELWSPHPTLWIHYRSAELIAPHHTDRFHIGKSDLMLRFLGEEYDFVLALEDYLKDHPNHENVLLSTCLDRPGEARFTCPPDFGSEDIVEFMCHMLDIPYRIHGKICFNMLTSRFNSGVKLENNCDPLETDELRGYVTELTKPLYIQPYSQNDHYDNLFAMRLHIFLSEESARLGRDVSFLDLGAGVGTYVSALQQFHPNMYGMDARMDLQDMLGEYGIVQDLTRPLPRLFRAQFDWVLAFNMTFPGNQGYVRFLNNLRVLPRVGIIAFADRHDYRRESLWHMLDTDGWVEDLEAEHEFQHESGLLCCREMFQWVLIMRKEGLPADERRSIASGSTLGSPASGLESLPSAATNLEHLYCGLENSTSMDWMDFKVPAGDVIWGSCADGGLTSEERKLTILYLQFFRLAIVNEEQFKSDVSTMQWQWNMFLSLSPKFFTDCGLKTTGRSKSATWCNRAWGVFEMLERSAARVSCVEAACPEALRVDCGMPADEWSVLLTTAIQTFLTGGADSISALTLHEALANFRSVHVLAEMARCRYAGEWPPVRFEYYSGFREVRALGFSPSLWGKYMFRIHAVAGVRS